MEHYASINKWLVTKVHLPYRWGQRWKAGGAVWQTQSRIPPRSTNVPTALTRHPSSPTLRNMLVFTLGKSPLPAHTAPSEQPRWKTWGSTCAPTRERSHTCAHLVPSVPPRRVPSSHTSWSTTDKVNVCGAYKTERSEPIVSLGWRGREDFSGFSVH